MNSTSSLSKVIMNPTDREQARTNPGSWMDETAVEQVLEGCDGAFVNTDSKQCQDVPVAYLRLPQAIMQIS